MLGKTIIICDHLAKGGGRLDLKSMHEFTKLLKRKVVISNEIIIHFKFPKPIDNNRKPYFDEAWNENRVKHKLNKMFSILDLELNEKLYI